MKVSKLRWVGLPAVVAILVLVSVGVVAQKSKYKPRVKPNQVPADQALMGIPMDMTPDQLPDQFRTQLRGDVDKSKGIAILKQNGDDVEYTFAWWGITSPVTQAHFHYGPHGQVGARALSICGVDKESPPCPPGTRNSISGVWKNADIAAIKAGDIVIAFHTQKYPAPVGEFAVYVPRKGD
jgi:hypothetical protein